MMLQLYPIIRTRHNCLLCCRWEVPLHQVSDVAIPSTGQEQGPPSGQSGNVRNGEQPARGMREAIPSLL